MRRAPRLVAALLAVGATAAFARDGGVPEVDVSTKKGTTAAPPTVERAVEVELAEPRRGASIDRASCSLAARRHAAAERGLRCPTCSSYEVVPKKGDQDGRRYTCCHCGKTADYGGFVSIHR